MTHYKFYKWGSFITCPGKFPEKPKISIWRYYRKNRKDKLEIDFSVFNRWFQFGFYLKKPEEL
jgi:hypothetical protein